MIYLIILVLLIGVGSLIGTIIATRTEETNYGQSTKNNIFRLTIIYVIVIFASLIGFVWYMIA